MNDFIGYAKNLNANDMTLSWIEKRIKDEYDQGEVEHIIDYLCSSDAPKRLTRATYEQMKSNAEKWIKAQSNKGKNIVEGENGIEIVLDFNDGFKFVKLISKEAYEREGYLMSHCVASYYGRDVEIFSLRDKNNDPHCTIEKDMQIKGKGNGDIHPKYIDYVVRFLEWTGMKVRDSEMEHLGYEKVAFIEYAKNVESFYRGKYVRKGTKVEYRDGVIIFTDLKKACSYKGNKICLFDGNADFSNSKITNLGNLTSIGGDAYFSYSKITDLGNLTSIGGGADFSNSNISRKLNFNRWMGRFQK